MKTLNDFVIERLNLSSINERLRINNDSKISKHIPRKFVYKTTYTRTEVDIIEKYAQQLEIKPVLMTNEEYSSKYRSSRSRSSSSSSLFLYFDDDLENTYRIWFIKDELSNDWHCRLIFRYDEYCYFLQDKKGNILYSENVEDICKELLIQIKDTRFYEEVKEFYMEHFECGKLSITERLKLNNDSKIRKPIPTKFSDDFLFTDKEIDIIQSYMRQIKIRPCILTNYILVNGTLSDYSNNVFIYFNENWHKEHPSNYLFITKNPNNSKMTVDIVTNFVINDIYDNKDLRTACNIILNYLNKRDFYDAVKNN